MRIRWCETCVRQETDPHEHNLIDAYVAPAPDGKLVKVATQSQSNAALWQDYATLFRNQSIPFPDHDVLVRQLSLFASPMLVRRLLHFHHLTQLVKDTPGDWLEFGVGYGRDLAWWYCFQLLETHRHTYTRIVGFDTWEGHVGSGVNDGGSKYVKDGAFATPEGYETFLEFLLSRMADNFPLGAGFQLWKGDVRDTLPEWMDANPGTPIGFAYLDLDLYEPTRFVLETIRPRLCRGSVVGFDEFGAPGYPGETRAVFDSWGLGALRRSPFGDWTYLVV